MSILDRPTPAPLSRRLLSASAMIVFTALAATGVAPWWVAVVTTLGVVLLEGDRKIRAQIRDGKGDFSA